MYYSYLMTKQNTSITKNAFNIKAFNLRNSFSGLPIKEIPRYAIRNGITKMLDNNTYKLIVHLNHWYIFQVKDKNVR